MDSPYWVNRREKEQKEKEEFEHKNKTNSQQIKKDERVPIHSSSGDTKLIGGRLNNRIMPVDVDNQSADSRGSIDSNRKIKPTTDFINKANNKGGEQ